MNVSQFGLGARWPRPDQAAVGALDHLPPSQWPYLASRWRAAGFDSEPLRRLARLQTAESPAGLRAARLGSSRRGGYWVQPDGPGQPLPAEAQRLQHRATLEVQDLMPEVLRSIGFDPAPADEEFTARCQDAVDIVQPDLDATGYGEYRMRARLGQGWPARVYAAVPDGAWGEGMYRGEHGSGLLRSAAQSVCDTLKEVHEIAWPVCAAHGRDPATSIWEDEPVTLIKKVPWWWCTRAQHALAPVGQLTAEFALML